MTCHLDKSTNIISVEYISSHNYPVALKDTVFHTLPKSTRNEIKSKLSLGVPVKDIYKNMRDGLAERDKRGTEEEVITKNHFLSRSVITDMKRHLNNGRRLHPENSISTHMLVKKLENEQ